MSDQGDQGWGSGSPSRQHYGQDPAAYYGQEPTAHDASGSPYGPAGGPPGYGGDAPYGAPGYGTPGYGAPRQYPAPYGPYYYVPRVTDSTAIISLVLGAVGLVMACFYGLGLLLGPAALYLGISSNRKINRSQGTLDGKGMAITGIVLGAIGTVGLVLVLAAAAVVAVVFTNGTF